MDLQSKFIFSIFCWYMSIFVLIFFGRSHSLLLSQLKNEQSFQYQVLNVSASLQQANEVFLMDEKSTTSEQLEDVQQLMNSSYKSFAFSLHPRSSLVKPIYHNNYTALILSRLARDLTHVNSLISHHKLAISRMDFRPREDIFQHGDLQSPVTSGKSLGMGEYFARIGVGQPVKEFYMIIDTGSDVNWLQCEPCSHCYKQLDPVFKPSKSSTYKNVSCNAYQCAKLGLYASCDFNTCHYQVAYGDGSYTYGNLATETMSFGSSGSLPNITFGCGHKNRGLFVGAAGLLGLGGGTLSFPSQIKAKSFSYCLVYQNSNRSSTIEFNSAVPGDSILAPLIKSLFSDTYIYVGLTGIAVGGQLLKIPPSIFKVSNFGEGGIILDCGTTVTRLQVKAYNLLRDTFVKLTQHLPTSSRFSVFDTCYNLSTITKPEVPTISFHFSNGRSLLLPPPNYLVPVDTRGKFCLAFAPIRSSISVFGSIQQQGMRVSFDLANKVIGFSLNKC